MKPSIRRLLATGFVIAALGLSGCGDASIGASTYEEEDSSAAEPGPVAETDAALYVMKTEQNGVEAQIDTYSAYDLTLTKAQDGSFPLNGVNTDYSNNHQGAVVPKRLGRLPARIAGFL
ncbi:hypothetical protein BJ956_000540 [Arthrobacter psychrochitiniphilus]|uniref:Uncharacterized protein n=1 Tax=Arthrobacter psychrochitiniphilus TaxID=291045 RepID=A0A2V3DNP1_9MICC|nr:hypothetical protein [Arthrobacter psychrochitiniphilus]PXA64026.1 hypothetical protein CVS29_17390 [Arthrobacter psychrochitiniphilus]